MATKATIIWDKEARKTYFEMLEYLAREFSLQSAENQDPKKDPFQ